MPDEVVAVAGVIGSALDTAQAKWFIGGSVASSRWGRPRSTYDIDIVAALSPAMVPRLVRDLGHAWYADPQMIIRAIASGRPCNVIHQDTQVKVDLYGPDSMPMDHEALGRRRSEVIDGIRLWFASPEDVILSKLLWHRLGGGVSERQISDVAGVIEQQALVLDRSYLDRWITTLDLRQTWDRACATAAR